MPWRERWTFVSWANNSVGTQSCPTSPGRSAGRSDPTRPWYVRVLDSTGQKFISGAGSALCSWLPTSGTPPFRLCKPFSCKACLGIESKTRTHYGPVESGRRMAGRRGGAGLGRTGRRRVDLARRQPSLLLSSESKKLSWTTLRKLEQTKSYINR